MKIIIIIGAIFLAGCASNSGVVLMGQDTFMVSRQAATGFSGSGTLKAEALQEASQYCANQNMSLQVINIIEAKPPYIFTNFPKAEVQFRCFDANQDSGDMYTELKKLKELLDTGIINQEEFDARKKKIMAK